MSPAHTDRQHRIDPPHMEPRFTEFRTLDCEPILIETAEPPPSDDPRATARENFGAAEPATRVGDPNR
jgi:hypothetical protein